jgi:hypothetical protein
MGSHLSGIGSYDHLQTLDEALQQFGTQLHVVIAIQGKDEAAQVRPPHGNAWRRWHTPPPQADHAQVVVGRRQRFTCLNGP